ncbi:transposase [Streptomyces sp. NPDC005474]|uniref:IS701 family transposase n=1 Tax=Streptomyces sp. NPDC005474 TaxID=3154878 RepID=UPI003451D3B1
MTQDLNTLLTVLYVKIDDELGGPYLAEARKIFGRPVNSSSHHIDYTREDPDGLIWADRLDQAAERAHADPDMAKAMVLRAVASPLPIAWVTADAAYGQEWRLRRMLEETGLGYVLAVPKSQQVPHLGRIDHLFSQAPDEAWERRSCGDGAKGPRVYRRAALQITSIEDFDGEMPTHQRWALARRSISKPEDIAYYLGYAPLSSTVEQLVRVAGMRWVIEEAFQAAKNECGLDQYEVRRYTGWMRHITLAMLAHAFLAVMAACSKRGSRNGSCLAPLTVAEVRRLLATVHSPIAVHQSLISARALSWSRRRRRRQAVARRCHYQRRLHTIEGRPGKENTGRPSAHCTHPNLP